MSVLQKTSIHFFNDFQPQCILVKCTSAIFFIMVNSGCLWLSYLKIAYYMKKKFQTHK